VTSKIRSCREFQYKYGRLEVSQRDATERRDKDQEEQKKYFAKYKSTEYRTEFVCVGELFCDIVNMS